MREQDDASVDRFLDGLDDRRDELAEEQRSRRSRRDVPTWDYMTWRITHGLGATAARVRVVDGEEVAVEERPSLYEALVRAGEDGWELVAATDSQGMIFKRPRAEG